VKKPCKHLIDFTLFDKVVRFAGKKTFGSAPRGATRARCRFAATKNTALFVPLECALNSYCFCDKKPFMRSASPYFKHREIAPFLDFEVIQFQIQRESLCGSTARQRILFCSRLI